VWYVLAVMAVSAVAARPLTATVAASRPLEDVFSGVRRHDVRGVTGELDDGRADFHCSKSDPPDAYLAIERRVTTDRQSGMGLVTLLHSPSFKAPSGATRFTC
jgi:hypothetical protein